MPGHLRVRYIHADLRILAKTRRRHIDHIVGIHIQIDIATRIVPGIVLHLRIAGEVEPGFGAAHADSAAVCGFVPNDLARAEIGNARRDEERRAVLGSVAISNNAVRIFNYDILIIRILFLACNIGERHRTAGLVDRAAVASFCLIVLNPAAGNLHFTRSDIADRAAIAVGGFIV